MVISLYAALLGVMMVALSVHVIRGRIRLRRALGDDHGELRYRVRAQGNFAEYSTFFLVIAGLAEYQGLSPLAMHGVGVLFILGRLMHAYSLLVAEQEEDLDQPETPVWRIRGMICTLSAIGFISIALFLQFLLHSTSVIS